MPDGQALNVIGQSLSTLLDVASRQLDSNLPTRMEICRDSEGWERVSRRRDFDTTPCFEEGVIICSLLSAVLILTLLRTISIYFKQPLERSPKSIQILTVKLVSPSFSPYDTDLHSFNRCFWALL